jgi:hypothetical protein
MKKISIFYPFLLFVVLLQQSCSYSFTGASTLGMKTVSIQLFENNAPFVVPTLSLQLTEGLRERVRNQSKLNIIRSEADASFEGRITEYSNKPISVQANDQSSAGQERLTITVSVKYVNSITPKDSFEQSFTRYADYSLAGGRTFQAQEQGLIKLINAQLAEDIFNKAFANW